jgi:hypothetical protein
MQNVIPWLVDNVAIILLSRAGQIHYMQNVIPWLVDNVAIILLSRAISLFETIPESRSTHHIITVTPNHNYRSNLSSWQQRRQFGI